MGVGRYGPEAGGGPRRDLSPPGARVTAVTRRENRSASSKLRTKAAAQSGAESHPSREVITDARAMRAVAHPLRVALIEAITREGAITATRAAELLDESPGNMSWHLQTLARYGLVEETGEGRGRSRPWRLTSDSRSFETAMTDPETAIAGQALERTVLARICEQISEWWSQRLTYPPKWRRAAFMNDSIRYLTPDELAEVSREILAIYDRYKDRVDRDKRPAGALPVRLYSHGHPLPPTPSGN